MKNQENSKQPIWIGIVLVTIGGYFLLRNLGMIPSFLPYYLFGWESLFILIGGGMLASGRKQGIIFLSLGIVGIVPEIFDGRSVNLFELWPVGLIAVGIYIMIERKNQDVKFENLDHDHVNETSIFGGSEKSITSQNFKGGKITSIFGGSELNFSEAKMHGTEIMIDMFCLFGGNTLTIPADWTVMMENTVIFGGYSEKHLTPSVPKDPNKILKLKGMTMFGGGEIRFV